MSRRRVSPAVALLALAGGLSACDRPAPPASNLAKELVNLPGDEGQELPVTNGAVYQGNVEGGGGLELFRDHRIWRVGDILTVEIVQNAVATKNVSQDIGRADDVESTVSNFFGLPLQFGHSSSTTKYNPNLSYQSNNTLKGSGGTAQSDSFVTTASAMVTRVRPNGDLVVAGDNEVKLVGGKEYIRLAGVIRPEDITAGNTVNSTQMAEAHIEFSGDGETYLAPKMGFLQRLFLTVSTAWPF